MDNIKLLKYAEVGIISHIKYETEFLMRLGEDPRRRAELARLAKDLETIQKMIKERRAA